MAFAVNASVMAETIYEPEAVDINGYSCYERDGSYWTVIAGEEYLVINLDELTDAASEDEFEINPLYDVSGECPIGRPPFDEWVYNGYVELSESNGYAYTDRCYLTYGDYCSPIYCFMPKNPNDPFTATLKVNVESVDTYYFNIW